jgi:hypothetical protein
MRPFTNKTICGPASPVRTTRCRSASSRSLCPTVRPKEWSAGSTRCCQTTTAAAVGTNTAAPPRKSYGSWDCRTSSERSTGKEGNAHVEDGIQAIPRGHLFGLIDLNPNLSLYYFVLFIFLFGLFIIQRITHSPFGRVLVAVCENEPRAISLGYKTHRYKLLAFVLSAGLSILAGAMKVLVFQLASLTDVHWHASRDVVLMTLLGGVVMVLVPVEGAFLLVAIQDYFAQVGAWVTNIQGIIFVACLLTLRLGIVEELREWWQRRNR